MVNNTNFMHLEIFTPFINILNLYQDSKQCDIPKTYNSRIFKKNNLLNVKPKVLELKKIIDHHVDLIVSLCKSLCNLACFDFELKDEIGFYKSKYFNESLKKHENLLGVKFFYEYKREDNTLGFIVKKTT